MKKITIYDISLSAILLALLIIGSKITIPLGFISLTMQLPVVFLIIFLTKKRLSVLIVATYLILGLVGLPVFSTGGGFSYIYKPSFGFIIGFLVAAIVCPKSDTVLKLIISIFVGMLAVYVTGSVYMYMILTYYMNKSVTVMYVLDAAVFPFLAKDIICAYLAAVLAYRLKNIVSYEHLFNRQNKEVESQN